MASVTFATRANPAQQQAITTSEGPMLIIAGPGSGKTFTLVERIVYLIMEKEAAPESLFVVTFTEKAAAELKTRISNRLHELGIRFNLNEMYLGTFHSICLRWLQDYREFTRLKRSFTLMDQFDQQYFLYQRLREYEEVVGLEHIAGSSRVPWYRSQNLQRWINTVAEEALDPAELSRADHEEVRALGDCAAIYHRQLEEANALDFSTIQYEALRLLRHHPDVLAELQGRIDYLMVDEYQDTNTIQEQILDLLAGERPNLCVVGDDDQGLYRFRGATIRNILQFREKYPGCEQVELTTNYRSHPEIIRFYNQWIQRHRWSHNGRSYRYAKQIVPRDDRAFADVSTVVKVRGRSREAWQREVLAFLHALRDEGNLTDWNQVAFLFSSVKHDDATTLADFLEANGISVYAPRANKFFDREEVRLLIGALIFLFPQFAEARKWNANAELAIWTYYDEACFGLFAGALREPEHADLRKWAAARAREHLAMATARDYAFSGLFYELLRFPLFSRYLHEERLQSGLLDSRAMRNLGIFSQLLSKFEYLHHISVLTPDYLEKNLRDLFNGFLRFLYDGGIDEYEDEAEYAPSGAVSFLTIHQSKGLEFPVVVVDSLYNGPRKSYGRLDEILEHGGYLSRPPYEPLERMKYYDFARLYYTAFSRAQNILALTAHERDGYSRSPSKHFVGVYDQVLDWRAPAFRPQAVTLATIKEIRLKQEYAFTGHITVFENCAEQYRFFKELAFAPVRTSPILFGTLVHQTIEDIHKAVLRGEEAVLSEEQIGRWFDTNYAYLTKRERVYLDPNRRRQALQHVLRYYGRHRENWDHILEAEVDVSLVKEAYILSGTVDLIQNAAGEMEIVDFKSERAKPDVNDPEDRERLDRYQRQLDVYAHIVEERSGRPVGRAHLYYTGVEGASPYITFEKDRRSIRRTMATFDEVVARIEAKDFRIAERPLNLCKECDMRHYCDAKNWRFRQVEQGR